MLKKTTGDRLREIMYSRGLKQKDILDLTKKYSEKMNVKLSKTDLSQYVNNKVSPRQDKISLLSIALGINEAWLMGYDNVPMERSPKIVNLSQPTTTLTLVTDTTAKLEEPRQKNVLTCAEKELKEQEQEQAKLISLEEKRKEKERFSQNRESENRGALGAGLGVSNFYEDIVDEDSHEWPTIPIPDDAPCDFDWVYTASGDSMEPLFQDEDIVYVKALDEYERSNLDTNNIYAVRVDGISYLKKIRITEHGMYLVSLNKKYEDILVSEESNIKVVGKVVV